MSRNGCLDLTFLIVHRYANRAKNIKNRAVINEDPKDAMLREFQKEIETLRKKLAEESGSEESSEEEVMEDGRRVKRKRQKCKPSY